MTTMESTETGEIVSLMRYTSLDELIKMIRLGGIPLYNTEHWEDRCDAAFVERGVREMSRSKTIGKYGVMCFMGQTRKEKEEDGTEEGKGGKEGNGKIRYSYSPNETIHHWKGYAGGKDDVGIKICFNPCVLLNAFLQKNYGDKEALNGDLKKSGNVLKGNGRMFGAMEYKIISEIQKETMEENPEKFFFTKRAAFKDEREYRLVQYGGLVEPSCKDCQKMDVMGLGGFIPVDNWPALIERVIFSPFSDEQNVENLRKGNVVGQSLDLNFREFETLKQLFSSEKKSYRSGILNNKTLLRLASSDQSKT